MNPIIFDHANKTVVVVNDPASLRRYQQLVAAQIPAGDHKSHLPEAP